MMNFDKMYLETLKNNYAKEQEYEDWENLKSDTLSNGEDMEAHMNEICIRAQKAALENAYDKLDSEDVVDLDWKKIHKVITNPENLIR